MRNLVHLVLAPVLAGTLFAAAPPAQVSVKGKPADVFVQTKLWQLHFTVQAKDWEKMAPTRGMFMPGKGQPKAPAPSDDRKPRGGFGFDFEYVRADLSIDGARLKDVGLRFKGNSTYMTSQGGLKRPFRLDLDRYVEGQHFKGVRNLVLSNHIIDPSALRESLGFAFYREAGLPSPRTAYAEVYLTIPGKHQRELLGLYTLVEAVDKSFLKAHFGSSKGLLVKPEGVGALEYIGEDWKEYERRYRPKDEADEKQQKKLIDLCWLVQRGDDATFRAEIGKRIDVDEFLRYFAATTLLASVDSFMGLAHNYYLYLTPKTGKFSIIPWDLDHAYGGFAPFVAKLDELSVATPKMGNNRLVERLLADEKHKSAYKAHVQRLMKTAFTVERTRRDAAALRKVTEGVLEREKQATEARKEKKTGMFGGMMLREPPGVVSFVDKRVASVEAQLSGKSKGSEVKSMFGGGGPAVDPLWLALSRPLLAAADKDRDGKLTRAELVEGAKALFAALDPEKKGLLTEKQVAATLTKLLPSPHDQPPKFVFFGPQPANPAKSLVEKAGKDGKLSADSLMSAVEKTFASADRDRDGKLDERELAEALRQLVPPPPPFGMPPPPKKEDKK